MSLESQLGKFSYAIGLSLASNLLQPNVFDSSVQCGTPAKFPVNGVIQGWVEVLQLMTVGSKWRLFIPPHMAYCD